MIENAFKLSAKQGLKIREWIPIAFIVIIAILIRLYITSGKNYYLLAGADGPYFPLQVKSLLENFRLGYHDMPLVFLLGAFIAKILMLLHIASESESILLSVRMIDAFLPPLAAIPVFLIAKELVKDQGEMKKDSYLMVAFSVLNFTPLVIFSNQLQKNALAVIWVFFFLFFLIRLLKEEKRSDLFKALFMLLLCALTHFGSFALLVFISIVVFIFWAFASNSESRRDLLKRAGPVVFVLVISMLLIAFFDLDRFKKLLLIPLKIFEAPVLLYALYGQNFLLKGRTLLILIVFNCMSLAALRILIRNKRSFINADFIMGLSLIISTFILTSPMLGLEWANRLFMVTYIPITLLYLIVFNSVRPKWIYKPSIVIFFLLISFSLFYAMMVKPVLSISSPAFSEFEQIKEEVHFQRNDALVGRQDLRLLGSWVYGTKGISAYLLTKDAFNSYETVYFFKQLKGKNENLRETETAIPVNSMQVFKGNYFEVFRLIDNSGLKTELGKIFKGVRGQVKKVTGSTILVKDTKTGFTKRVWLLPETTYNYLHKGQAICVGMKVEINGEWKPFSVDIDAISVTELENP